MIWDYLYLLYMNNNVLHQLSQNELLLPLTHSQNKNRHRPSHLNLIILADL